jgi:hypothetical protein
VTGEEGAGLQTQTNADCQEQPKGKEKRVSHLTKIQLDVHDLDALKAAAARFAGELVAQKTYNWYGQHIGDYPMPAGMTKEQLGKCDYAIKLPGVRYEVGVVKQADGSYGLLYDFYGYGEGTGHDGHKLKETFGDGLKLLSQAYAIETATKSVRKLGWSVKETKLGNGSIKLQMIGM